jgi:membrane fusion protein (multidrug efflux system)
MLCLGCVAGCDRLVAKSTPENDSQNRKSAADESKIVIPVQAELPKRGDISSHFETTARVEAENRVQVLAEGIGECQKMYVQEGDHVKAGDILAELDKKTVLATIGQTEVQVRQTKTALDIAEHSLAEGIGAKAERDNAQFAHEQALAARNMQKVQLEKLTVRAPISGVITKKSIQEGQLIASGTPVFTIVDPSSFMLVINPPERELARLRVGQVAKVTIDALGNQEFEATVRRINPGVDSTSGTVKVTLDFDEATRSKLRESAFARVRLIMETHQNALLIAKDTLIEENARKYVFVVQHPKDEEKAKPENTDSTDPAKSPEEAAPGGKPQEEKEGEPTFEANRLEVQIGLEDSSAVEILSGLDDQSLVVTLGQHTLKPGSQVVLTNADDEILSKAGLSTEEALKEARAKRVGTGGSRGPEGSGGSAGQHRHRHP